ncbi:uncharacterized protein LOC129884139 [Solanum dulcamara]|uniref:uncharacterized protein LOC129884139 n=1 Tax=Solanum dulcamara TaxID=45834 RepID=UPI0024861F26|nr:uncharacterized protein LOC129884139 [Solanum dulcamara]
MVQPCKGQIPTSFCEHFLTSLVQMEVEDDLFFADLSKQISLLIMDDDEHEHQNSKVYRDSPDDSLQAFSQVMYPTRRAGYVYEQNNRREISKGTGVFIPLSSHLRRKNRQPRHNFSSKTTKIQGQTERQLINQVPPHYNSLNPTRFS